MLSLEWNDIRSLSQAIPSEAYMESNVYRYRDLFIKRFKIKGTKYNPESCYLTGKFAKAELLAVAFRDHSQIIAPVGILTDRGTPAGLVYPFIEQASALEVWINSGLLSEAKLTDFFLRISDQVRVLHEHRYVHADLGPNNILVDRVGQVFLVDLDNAGIGHWLPDGRNSFTMRLLRELDCSSVDGMDFDRITVALWYFIALLGPETVFRRLKQNVQDWPAEGRLTLLLTAFRQSILSGFEVPYFNDLLMGNALFCGEDPRAATTNA